MLVRRCIVPIDSLILVDLFQRLATAGEGAEGAGPAAVRHVNTPAASGPDSLFLDSSTIPSIDCVPFSEVYPDKSAFLSHWSPSGTVASRGLIEELERFLKLHGEKLIEDRDARRLLDYVYPVV